jgi:hypothetical protein
LDPQDRVFKRSSIPAFKYGFYLIIATKATKSTEVTKATKDTKATKGTKANIVSVLGQI